jgi:hypothetical protein
MAHCRAPDDFLVDQYHLDRVRLRSIVNDIVADRTSKAAGSNGLG